MSLEAANGGTLATLLIGNGGSGFANGTFAVTGGSADGFNIGVGADGDTVLTTSQTPIWGSNTSGIWQPPTSWVGGVVPAATAFIGIGQSATTAFTLTTGSPRFCWRHRHRDAGGDASDHQQHDADV